ncbi:MAG: hypothetical protein ACYTG2_00225 [Planctomycetota bacterium]|jgi:hypothetical protein
MATFNAISTAIFDVLLAPFGGSQDWHVWISLLLWSFAFGIIALIAFKYCSFQDQIASAKNRIKVHLLEIRLFGDDIAGVVLSTIKIVLMNVVYIGHNLLPMVVMAVPMVALLAQLEARYAFAPAPPGTVTLLKVELDRNHTDVPVTGVRLDLPDGVVLDAPPVRTPRGEIAWRLRAEAEGDHVLQVRVGDELYEKAWAVGGTPRKVPVMRTKGWEGLLYPGEAALASDASLASMTFSAQAPMPRGYPERDLGWMPGGELGIMVVFLLVSIAAGLALKGVFKVTF